MSAWKISITKALIEEAEVLFEKESEKAYDISEIKKRTRKPMSLGQKNLMRNWNCYFVKVRT